MLSFALLMLLVFFDACNYDTVASNTSTIMLVMYSEDPNVQPFDPTSDTI